MEIRYFFLVFFRNIFGASLSGDWNFHFNAASRVTDQRKTLNASPYGFPSSELL